MTIGVTLLNLTTEYQQAKAAADAGEQLPGRTPEEIAADYESTLRGLAGSTAAGIGFALG